MLQQQTTSKLDEYKEERKLDVRIYGYFKDIIIPISWLTLYFFYICLLVVTFLFVFDLVSLLISSLTTLKLKFFCHITEIIIKKTLQIKLF